MWGFLRGVGFLFYLYLSNVGQIKVLEMVLLFLGFGGFFYLYLSNVGQVGLILCFCCVWMV